MSDEYKKVCGECGRKVPQGLFCDGCGAELAAVAQPPPLPVTVKEKQVAPPEAVTDPVTVDRGDESSGQPE